MARSAEDRDVLKADRAGIGRMDTRERDLIAINTLDILAALGLSDLRVFRRGVELAFRHPARTLARRLVRFDDEVVASGLRAAAPIIISAYVRNLEVNGAARIPARGPVILLSNHPGMTDTVCLCAAIPRPDLKILAADRPFLRALPAASRSLFFLPDQPEKRRDVLRKSISHLRAGGALLTFPAGGIEPDPSVLPGAAEALAGWSASTTFFLRFVPDALVIPIVVSGVLSRRAQRNPLTRIRKKRTDRERFGAMLQAVTHTIFPRAWPVRVRVDILQAFIGRELARAEDEGVSAIRERVADFLRSCAQA
ncbi:MAG: 1-acyl-sn-glycerol-3-phosphate acyltransferase [Spirochaetia bacterium]